MRWKSFVTALVIVLAASSARSYAQPAPVAAQPADDEATEKMRERFEKGQDYYEQKKFDLAAGAFREAYEIKPAASLLYNEAVCYEKMKDFGKAATLFREYLSRSGNARDKKAVETRIAALDAEVQKQRNPTVKVDPAKPSLESLGQVEARGVFLIDSKPQGATIYLDDKKNEPLGTTPWNGTIEGVHKLIVVNKGYKDYSGEIRGKPNSVNTHFVGLSQEHYLGWIEVRANIAAADVYIDDKTAGAAGRTPYLGNITPGKHTFIITKEGFTEAVKEIEIVAGEAHKIDAMLDKAAIGFIQVGGATVEGAKVYLDGKVVCQSAPCKFTAPSGDRKITVEKQGLKPYTRKLTVPKASETALSVKLMPKQPRTDLIWKFGFAAAFIGGGVFLGLQANKTHDDINADIAAGNPPLLPDDDRFLKGKIYAIAADGLFVVGGLTAIFGVVSLLSEKGPPSTGFISDTRDLGAGLNLQEAPRDTRKALITPAFGPGYAGVAAEVRW